MGTPDNKNKNWVRLTNGRWLPIYIGEHRVLQETLDGEDEKEVERRLGPSIPDKYLPTADGNESQRGFKPTPNISSNRDPSIQDTRADMVIRSKSTDSIDESLPPPLTTMTSDDMMQGAFDDAVGEEADVVAPMISKGVGHLDSGVQQPRSRKNERRPTAVRPLSPEQQQALLAKVDGKQSNEKQDVDRNSLPPDEYLLTFNQRPLGLTVWRNDDAHTIIHEIDSKDLEDQGAKTGDRIVMVNGMNCYNDKYPQLLYKLRTENLPLVIVFKRSDENLPAPWTKVWSQSQNKPYYFNNVTGDCVWNVAEVYKQ